jgi:hypothetical protein
MPFYPKIGQHKEKKSDAHAIQRKKYRHGRWTSSHLLEE